MRYGVMAGRLAFSGGGGNFEGWFVKSFCGKDLDGLKTWYKFEGVNYLA